MNALLVAAVLTASQLNVAALTSARACWGESREDVAVCVAQVHVMLRRAERSGRTLIEQWWAYSQALKRAEDRRPWLLDMFDRDRPPRGWETAGASWSVVRPLFARLVDAARGAIVGDVPDPCAPQRPTHFGSCRLDGQPAGFERATCLPAASQCFWVRAGQQREPDRLFDRVRVVEGES